MKKGKVGFENKGLVILLGVLGVMIVGLVVGIVMVNVQGGDEAAMIDEDDDSALPEELMGDNLSVEDQVTKKTSLMLQDPDISEENIELYYDTVIEDAMNDKNIVLAINIIIQKMNFLVVLEDDCEKARDYVNGLDVSFYSVDEKRYLASNVVSSAIECDDLDWQNQWESVYNEGV